MNKTKPSITTMELIHQCWSKELMLGKWCHLSGMLKPWVQSPALRKLHMPVILIHCRNRRFKVEKTRVRTITV